MIKKSISKQQKKKKQKRTQWIAGSVLILVMMLSAFGIAANSFVAPKEEKIIYKGLEFKQINSYYVLEIGEAQFYFLTNPKTFDSLDAKITLSNEIQIYISKPLYVSSENPSFSRQIYQNMAPYVERIQPACLEEENCSNEDYPIKDCSNNFIIIKESTENKIYEKDNCVFIEGKQEDLLTLTDKFILEIIGIK